MAKTTKAKSKKPELSDVELRSLIKEGAYYKAEERDFMPGFEYQDWFEAEKDVTMKLQKR